MVIMQITLIGLELSTSQKKLKKTMVTKIQIFVACDSIMHGYFCNGFVDFMIKRESLLDYTNLISPNGYERNDKIILKYF